MYTVIVITYPASKLSEVNLKVTFFSPSPIKLPIHPGFSTEVLTFQETNYSQKNWHDLSP